MPCIVLRPAHRSIYNYVLKNKTTYPSPQPPTHALLKRPFLTDFKKHPPPPQNGDCLHVWLTGRADLLRLFQRTLFRQADPVSGDAVRFLYTLLSTPPCERRYA